MTARRPSLRRVLVVAIGAVALTAVTLTALIGIGLSRVGAERRALDALGREADELGEVAEALPCDGRPPRSALRALGPRVRFVPERVRGPITALEGDEGRTAVAGRDTFYVRRAATLCGVEGTLFVFRPAVDVPSLPEGLSARLVLAGLVSLLVAAAVAFLVAGRVARPLGRLAGDLRAFPSGEDSARLHDARRRDPREIADLRDSFVSMASDVRDARARERAFLLSVSHELRTPLTAIRGYGEALADGTARGAKATLAGSVIVRESERLERLVRDLIELARLGSEGFGVEPVDVDLDAVASDVVSAMRPTADEAGIVLEQRGRGAVVRTDADRVHQMAGNLVENALRVTPSGGRVVVETDGPAIIVSDGGPGLGADDLEHVFERFYLWRRYRGERPVGTGLGLAIVEELADRLGVRVSVDSQPGYGTTFRLKFDA